MKQGRNNSKWSEIKAKFTWRSEHTSRKWRMKQNRSPKSARLLAKWARARARTRKTESERSSKPSVCAFGALLSFFLPPAAGNRVTRGILGQQTISPGTILSAYYLPFAQLGKFTFFSFTFFHPSFLWRYFSVVNFRHFAKNILKKENSVTNSLNLIFFFWRIRFKTNCQKFLQLLTIWKGT